MHDDKLLPIIHLFNQSWKVVVHKIFFGTPAMVSRRSKPSDPRLLNASLKELSHENVYDQQYDNVYAFVKFELITFNYIFCLLISMCALLTCNIVQYICHVHVALFIFIIKCILCSKAIIIKVDLIIDICTSTASMFPSLYW